MLSPTTTEPTQSNVRGAFTPSSFDLEHWETKALLSDPILQC